MRLHPRPNFTYSALLALSILSAGACSGGSDEPPRDPVALSGPSSGSGTGALQGTPAPTSTEVAPNPPPTARKPVPGFVVDHTSIESFDRIPKDVLAKAKGLHVFYGRLSHGDQLLGGLKMVKKARGAEFDLGASIEPFYSSLDPGRDTPEWEGATKDRLRKGGVDVVMWAWSGNVGRPDRGGTDEYIQQTLEKMDRLEAEYPSIQFVYHTGPAQTWAGATDYAKHNATIRKFAREHGKVLYDFEDIELHAPDGSTRASDTDGCEWCDAWCKGHDCSMVDTSVDCVANFHTHCFNVYRKGLATWVLLARLAGWSG